jgi:flavin-dependent dehydrogenase
MASHLTDVVVIGGGPAGLAAAIALRNQGLTCLVVDQNHPNIDKACGEGLMPDCLTAFSALGITITANHGAPFRGIRFADQDSSVNAGFPAGAAVGIRRTKLHRILVGKAMDAGATLIWDAKPKLVDKHNLIINDQHVRTQWLIGADGQSSPVRQFCGLHKTWRLATRYGIRRHFEIKPWSEFVEVHWRDCGQMYVTPVSAELVCVALVTRDPYLRMDDALPQFSELSDRLARARVATRDLGSITTTRRLRSVVTDTVALAGDASGSVDAITGEGIAIACKQAIALADAIKRGDLSQYQRAHNAILRLPTAMASLLLLLDEHPEVRKRTFAAMAAKPETFARFLSAHIGYEPLWRFAWKEAPALSWQLLRAQH